ncbi:MAG: hypothetical protein U1E29_12565 [Coriobacteriia bacterium]|jgi:hypothetical protein|nr:hypothetical protein [Coriobacteriia bacterium]
MGTGTVALVMFPIYLITGEPVTGLVTDIVVVGMWLLNIALGEWVAWRLASPSSRPKPSRRAAHPSGRFSARRSGQ